MKITVNLDALKANLTEVKKLVGDTKICAMVKSDAYGHGLKNVSTVLRGLVDYFGVANDAEANELRSAGITCPILITGALNIANVKFLFDKNITQALTTYEDLKILEHFGAVLDKKIKVHIKIDTGMNRLGIDSLDIFEDVINFLNQSKYIVCEGVFTHFAVNAFSDPEYFELQRARFESYVSKIKANYPHPLIVHCLSSGGILTAPELKHDMVRVGILLYGYAPDKALTEKIALTPVLSASAEIVSVKRISAGEGIGYGRTCTLAEPKTVAVIKAGYGDGYKRALGGRGYAIINESRASILGRVCMDMFMADVTGIDVKRGDEAVLIGSGVSADDLADLCDTIPYEILTSLKARAPSFY